MAYSFDFGMHLLNNNWNPQSKAHAGITSPQQVDMAAAAGASILRTPIDL